MRYFLSVADNDGFMYSVVKNLRQGFSHSPSQDLSFLHQYLTLTRCDLFFADKAILIEGTSERLLLPTMISKVDSAAGDEPKLGSQYLTIMEVGGAYAHLFFELLDYLDLPTLIITDLDPVKPNGNNRRVSVSVADGIYTSNACLNTWFFNGISPADLLAKNSEEKIRRKRRIAYQIPETNGGPCGRSLEDAFILANSEHFSLGLEEDDLAEKAYNLAGNEKKSTFALKYAITETEWVVPRYIAEGLQWLAQGSTVQVNDPVEFEHTVELVAEIAGVGEDKFHV
jgi:predicted ATP-dependent endonuclease of OLD family